MCSILVLLSISHWCISVVFDVISAIQCPQFWKNFLLSIWRTTLLINVKVCIDHASLISDLLSVLWFGHNESCGIRKWFVCCCVYEAHRSDHHHTLLRVVAHHFLLWLRVYILHHGLWCASVGEMIFAETAPWCQWVMCDELEPHAGWNIGPACFF